MEKILKKWELMSEDWVFQSYVMSWGVMAHKHTTCGSGWWRPRFTHAFKAGCIVYSDDKEFPLDIISPPLEKIECLTKDEGLEYLAKMQAREFNNFIPTGDESVMQLNDIMIDLEGPCE